MRRPPPLGPAVLRPPATAILMLRTAPSPKQTLTSEKYAPRSARDAHLTLLLTRAIILPTRRPVHALASESEVSDFWAVVRKERLLRLLFVNAT